VLLSRNRGEGREAGMRIPGGTYREPQLRTSRPSRIGIGMSVIFILLLQCRSEIERAGVYRGAS